MSSVASLLEPALQLNAYSTVADALPALAQGKPAWLHRNGIWGAVVSTNAVGHAQARRVIDLPLVSASPLSPSDAPPDIVTRSHAAGYLPVVEGEVLLGHVRVHRMEHEATLMRTDLALALAHDLNNAIWVAGALLEESRASAAVEKALHHAARLVTRLQGFAGRRADRPQSMDVGSHLAELLEWLRPVLKPIELAIFVQSGGRPLVASVDPAGIEQIVVNLVMNARDVLDGHGAVRVDIRWAGADLVVEVADNGPGIPTDLIPRVFEWGATSKGAHRGIGLASAASVAREMGATLTLDRTGPEGTVFRLALPGGRPG